MSRKSYVFPSVKALVLAAMLAAMGVVIGLFCKNFNLAPGIRITFENLPVVLSGILCGPIVGGLVGSVSDLCAGILTGQAMNPLINIGAFAVGFAAGIVPIFIRKRGMLQIATADLFGHLVGSMVIKTIALYEWFGAPVFLRIPVEIAIVLIEILILCFLFRRKSFCRIIDHL